MVALLLTPPALEPLSLAEAKAWLRIDSSAEDPLVIALVASARVLVERLTRRLLLTQTWRLTFDAWPHGMIAIPLAPFQSVAAVRVLAADETAQVLAPATYCVDAAPECARLSFAVTPPAPGRALAGITIDVVVGYGNAGDDVPEPLIQAMRLMVAAWFENRGDADPGAVPASATALIAPYRRLRLP